ncbi:MAG: hypothetical protein ABI042_14605, partial [Verrucomicrobiota bacterium]
MFYKNFPLRQIFFGFCALLFFTSHTFAATLTVTTTNDSGAGSLRLLVSNSVAGDTINFETNVNSIVLSNGPISLNKNLTILGPGPSLLRIFGSGSNLFNVSLGTVLISDMTLTNGFALGGGGVQLTGGTLTISNCAVGGNFAAAGQGGLGGGINASGGNLIIVNSTFNANKAHLGGALYNS